MSPNFIDDFGSEFCHYLNVENTKPAGIELIQAHIEVRNATPYVVKQNSKNDKCFTHCKMSPKCQTAQLNQDAHNCSLYSGVCNHTLTRSNFKIYQWIPCDLLAGKIDNPNRCAGNWIYIPKIRLRMTFFHYYYNSMMDADVKACAHYCNRNRACGGFNFIKRKKKVNRCRFIKFYNQEQMKRDRRKMYYGFQWVCADEQKLKLNQFCRPSNKGCEGRFTKVPLNASSIPKYVNLQYYTRSYRDCLLNCEKLPLCRFVIFSFKESNCFLLSNIKSKCSSNFHINNVSSYIMIGWECCTKHQTVSFTAPSYPQSPSPVVNRRCVCLRTDTNFRIRQLDCTKSFKSQILPHNKSTCRDAKLNCTIKQCFQLASNWTINQSHGEVIESYLLYTGYEEFLLQFTRNNFINFTTVFVLEEFGICDIYSAKLASRNLEKIITRKEWNADNYKNFPHQKRKTDRGILVSKETRKYVLIGNRRTTLCDCKTEESCESILNVKQANQMSKAPSCDFPYNFMVMQSGDVFEGIGFHGKLRPICTKRYMPLNASETIYIGVFGNFEFNFPTLNSLTSIKELINTAIHQGHLKPDYILYTTDYFHKYYYAKAPNLFNIIRLWKAYNGRTKIPCQSLSNEIIGINVIGVALIMMLVVVIIKYYHCFNHSQICGQILSLLTNESDHDLALFNIDKRIVYHEPFDEKSKVTNDIHKIKIDLYNTACFWLCNKQEVRGMFCTGEPSHADNCRRHVENYLKLSLLRSGKVRLAQLRMLLENSSCSVNYVTHFLYNTSSNILRKNVLIICHLKYTRSFMEMERNLLSLIINNYQLTKCFCKNIDLELLKFNDASQEMGRFKIDNRKLDCSTKEKFSLKHYWHTFSGLRYSFD